MKDFTFNPYDIGERLIKIRKERGVSQEEAAEFLDISRNTISRYENGTNKIPTEILAGFGQLYNVSVDYILTGRELSASEQIDIEVLSMIEGYTPMQLKAFMSILKGIQDMCKYVA